MSIIEIPKNNKLLPNWDYQVEHNGITAYLLELSVSFPHVFSFRETWLIQDLFFASIRSLSLPFFGIFRSLFGHIESLLLSCLCQVVYISHPNCIWGELLGLSVGDSSWNAWLEMIVNFILTFNFAIWRIWDVEFEYLMTKNFGNSWSIPWSNLNFSQHWTILLI